MALFSNLCKQLVKNKIYLPRLNSDRLKFSSTVSSIAPQLKYSAIPKSSNRFPEIADFLVKNFDAEHLVYVRDINKGSDDSEWRQFFLDFLEDANNLVAMTQENKIAGVCLYRVYDESDLKSWNKLLKSISAQSNMNECFLFINEENLKADLFNRLCVEKVFGIFILTIDPILRKQHIGRELLCKTINISKESGFKVVKAEPSNFYGEKILTSLGFQTASEIPFSRCLNSNGEQLFKSVPPHGNFKIMYKLYS